MKRHLFLVLSFATILGIIAIITIWTNFVPMYQAKAEIRVPPIIPYLVYETEYNGVIPLYDSYLNTQVSIIKSHLVLQRVLDQTEVQSTNWFRIPGESVWYQKLSELLFSKNKGKKKTRLEWLKENLSVKPRTQTEIIDVTFSAKEALDSKVILNTVLKYYLLYNMDKSDEIQVQLYEQLIEKSRKFESEILDRENRIKSILKSLGTNSVDELISRKSLYIDEIEHQLTKVQQNIDLLEWEKDKIGDLIKSDPNDDSNNIKVRLSQQKLYYSDPEWRKLDIDVRTIEFQIQTESFTDNNPESIRLHERLQFAKELLRLRESQIATQLTGNKTTVLNTQDQNYSEKFKGIEYQIGRSKKEKELLVQNLDKQEVEFDKMFNAAQLLEKERKELAYTEEQYDAIRKRKDQKDIERKVPSSIEILTGAFVPSEPYNDHRAFYTLITLIIWLSTSSLLLIVSRIRSVKSNKKQ